MHYLHYNDHMQDKLNNCLSLTAHLLKEEMCYIIPMDDTEKYRMGNPNHGCGGWIARSLLKRTRFQALVKCEVDMFSDRRGKVDTTSKDEFVKTGDD
ncbi:hypothetical protein FQA39_LY13500 [Lamprigera yunnana]|nr:hypothetical protein FQA39_LY13500 [Lamprigera yunnana]